MTFGNHRFRTSGAIGPMMIAAGLLSLLPLSRTALAQPGDDLAPAAAVSGPLKEIRIEGNLTIPAKSISRHIKSQPNRPPNPQTIREDVRALYATRWFLSVEPRFRSTDAGTILIFQVAERPMVRRVEYRGNEKIKTNHLEAITNLKSGSPFDISANRESARRIEAKYHEKGYAFATVELASGSNKDDRDVIFDINEGPLVKVVGVKFEGNSFFSSGLLKTKLRTKTALFGWANLGWLGGKYDPATIPDDIVALKQYYHSLGFFDVEIDKRENFSSDRSKVEIEYLIEEGTRYVVRRVELEGNRVLNREAIFADAKVLAGDYFNSRNLAHDVMDIQDQYGELGRLFAKIEAVPRFLEEPGQVDIVFQIDEDRVYRIRRINVHYEGDHPHTKETVILNRSLLHPGDLANNRLIQRTRSRIEGSQLFERGPGQGVRINITPVDETENRLVNHEVRGQDEPTPRAGLKPVSYRPQSGRSQAASEGSAQSDPGARTRPERRTIRGQSDSIFDPNNPLFGNSPQGDPLTNMFREPPPAWVDLGIYATEGRTGRMMFGVGVNSDAGVVGSIVLDETNFDLLNPPSSWADVINGQAFRGNGERLRLEAIPGNQVSRYMASWTNPYFLDTDYSLSLSGFYFTRFYPDWDENRAGGRIAIGKQITNEFSVNAALRLEDVELENPRVPTPQIVQDSVGNSLLSTGRFTAAHDTRDSAFLPSDGHLLELSYEQAFGDYDYPRLEAEARQYFTLHQRPDRGGRHILSVGGQVGWSGEGTPVFERYYAGGFQTFRGFEFRGVSPREMGTRIGGEFLLVGNVEYKLPVTADDTVALVFFSDFGTVEETVDLEQFRVSVGAGLRLTVPAMGPVPLAFDFAVPLMKEDFDATQVFSFYIGINR